MARRFVIDRGRMLPHQRAFWELPNFVKLLVGGVWVREDAYRGVAFNLEFGGECPDSGALCVADL